MVLSFWYLGRDLKPLFWLTGSDEDLGLSLARRVCLLKIFVQASGLLLLHQTYQEVSDLVLKERLRIEEHRRRGGGRGKRTGGENERGESSHGCMALFTSSSYDIECWIE